MGFEEHDCLRKLSWEQRAELQNAEQVRVHQQATAQPAHPGVGQALKAQ